LPHGISRGRSLHFLCKCRAWSRLCKRVNIRSISGGVQRHKSLKVARIQWLNSKHFQSKHLIRANLFRQHWKQLECIHVGLWKANEIENETGRTKSVGPVGVSLWSSPSLNAWRARSSSLRWYRNT
jgi:hypothetical protein